MNRISTLGRILIAALLITLMGMAGRHVFAQFQEEKEYFPKTGHWVTGEFLIKYHSIPNPEEIYGNPITEAFQEKDLTIQYFEKTRFELYPQDFSDLRVRLSPLGSVIYHKGQTLPGTLFNPSACRLYPQLDSGYYVCYDFLTFFDKNGGVPQFGYPISNFEVHDGWIVQYFQRARFEWHPENRRGNWVTVSNLGRQYFHLHSRDPRLLNPIQNDSNIISNEIATELNVRAYVALPVMQSIGNQTLYVIVQDQNHNPVEDVNLAFTVVYPNGDTQILKMRPTNKFGISISRFPINSKTIGTIELEVTTNRSGLENVSTITSFQVWW